MPLNKNASFRYRVINNCLRNQFRQWTLVDLIREVSDQMHEHFGITSGVSKRTVHSDINIMRSDPPRGFAAPILCKDGNYYYEDPEYSIDNNPLNEIDLRSLKDASDILRQFKGLPYHLELNQIINKIESTVHRQKIFEVPLIHFEYNDQLKGQEFLQPLLKCIQSRLAVEVRYQPFNLDAPLLLTIHPYFLKEYNNRWYLFGLEHDPRRLVNLALDRILETTDSKTPYIPNRIIDPAQFFNDIIGVTYNTNVKKQNVLLRFTKDRAPYVLTKPLHSSQKLISDDEDGITVSIEVVPNKELIRDILSFGGDIRVILPEDVAIEVEKILRKAADSYQN